MGPENSALREAPPPLVDEAAQLIVLWSPKAACTATYVWFSSVCGFLAEVSRFPNPHHHRMEVYRRSRRYRDSLTADTSSFRVVRIIRDPYERAVSIFREAFTSPIRFADKDAAAANLNFEEGVSFRQFLAMVARLDMQKADTHYRPQRHPFELVRKPDTVINVSKVDLFAGLNAVASQLGLPYTDFPSLGWLHAVEQSRRRSPHPTHGEMFDIPVLRAKEPVRTPFPEYRQLLTDEAKHRIEAIYQDDFSNYRDQL
jgi:hypothetical protein